MRINVYSQELILNNDHPVELVKQVADTGVTYCGIRLFLHSSDRLHHRPGDDDRSAITFWLPKSENNRKIMAAMFEDMASLIIMAPKETGLDE